jgi:microcin C transport system substrate-binding protein
MRGNAIGEGAGRHGPAPTRRHVVQGGVAVLGASLLPAMFPASRGMAQSGEAESHGLSVFDGDLALPENFPHLNYVNPAAPKGGALVVQLKRGLGNQNFDTFNTLNPFVLRGDGAAGVEMIFDTLMAGNGDEAGSAYGLVARRVRWSADHLTYRFLLRPEARFHDGSRLTAKDVAFSINLLRTRGHPSYRLTLKEVVSVEAEADDVVKVVLSPQRGRELHLIVGSLPILPEAFWAGRDFEAAIMEPPLGSGAYRIGRFEQGRFIEFERVADYWGRDLPLNRGQNNFDRIRYEYFRDRQVAFEAFKSGVLTFQEEFTSRIWATGYDFPALTEGRVKKETLPRNEPTGSQGWYFNTRREMFRDPRIREAIGLCFDFEWTNKNIMFGLYKRTTSFFENSAYKATGAPQPEELALLEPFRAELPANVFGEPFVPPVGDGSGNDRALLRRADELFRAAGCKREGGKLLLPNGKPFEIEFLDFQASLQPHTQPFQANLKRLGIEARSRIVDAAQYRRRMDEFDFDMASQALGGSALPGESLRLVYGSEAARTNGTRNIAGISLKAADAMLDRIANAKSRAELTIACRALDRVLRAGHYWVPMWWNPALWIAHWDMYDRPGVEPKLSSGAPGTWWFSPEKAKKIGRG